MKTYVSLIGKGFFLITVGMVSLIKTDIVLCGLPFSYSMMVLIMEGGRGLGYRRIDRGIEKGMFDGKDGIDLKFVFIEYAGDKQDGEHLFSSLEYRLYY